MTRHAEDTRTDALSISVLMRLMSSHTTTEVPALPLYRVRGLAEACVGAAIAFDNRRSRQIVLMSQPPGGWRLDPLDVVKVVGSAADVVMMDDTQTAHAMSEALTPQLAPLSGSVRILRPGLTEADRGRHPLVRPGKNGARPIDALREIERYVTQGLRHRPRTFGDSSPEEIQQEVDAALRVEREKHRDTTKELTSKLAAAKRALEKAEADLEEEDRPVYVDPHAQFRHDLHRAWLASTVEDDRGRPGGYLREWELGLRFLDSIKGQQLVSRRQVMRACVDVITGRHAELKSRASHKLRIPNRPEDGATPWRCAIAMGPGAARLMWWERKDGVVELSLVAHHDDIRIE